MKAPGAVSLSEEGKVSYLGFCSCASLSCHNQTQPELRVCVGTNITVHRFACSDVIMLLLIPPLMIDDVVIDCVVVSGKHTGPVLHSLLDPRVGKPAKQHKLISL